MSRRPDLHRGVRWAPTSSAAVRGGVAALLGLVTLGVRRRRRRLRDVAPELRSPVLYAPFSFRGDRSVRLVRALGTAAAPAMKVPPGVAVREAAASPAEPGSPPVRMLVYEPPTRRPDSGALLWIHGGGLVIGNPEQDHQLCAGLAVDVGIAVVSVDYRLAPEHPYPAGLQDCDAALTWVHDHAAELSIDPAKVAVGGGSAGGGLAARLAQLELDRGGPRLCFQLLQYPMLDDRRTEPHRSFAPVWTPASNRYAWNAYVRGSGDGAVEAAAPARRDDLRGLPPAWIGVGDVDLFHRECVEYAGRLRQAGVSADLHVVPGMYHAAERLVPEAPSMVDFCDRMTRALSDAMG